MFLEEVDAPSVLERRRDSSVIRPGSCPTGLRAAKVQTTHGDYFWPSGHGHLKHYSASPFSAPKSLNLSAPSWTWHYGKKWGTIPVGIAIDDRRHIYLTAADGIRKFSPDGDLVWTYNRRLDKDLEVINNAASLWEGFIYTITSAARVFALSMETGEEVWSTKVAPGASGNYGWVAASEGVVITGGDALDAIRGYPGCCGSADQVVFGLNATNGCVLWSYTPDVPVWNFMFSFVGDGTFVFQDLEGRAYRNRVKDGTVIWKVGGVLNSWTDGSLTLGPNAIVYAVSNTRWAFCPGYLTAYRLSDGKELWRQTLPRPPNSIPGIGRLVGGSGLSVVQPIGQQTVIGQNISIYTFDAETGKLQWIFDGPAQQGHAVAGDAEGISERAENMIQTMTAPNPWGAASIDKEGTVFIGGETGHFFALRDSNGDGRIAGDEEVSILDTEAAFVGSSGPAFAPGLMAVGSIGKMYVWQYPADPM